ncbi:MAG: hypothetical protein HUU15_02445 [Candidatus Brocadiae bacterium]|nr:hypothetical protein [Candidatus Brocadiia bacterium]
MKRILKNPPPESGGTCPDPEPDTVAEITRRLGLPEIPIMSSTIIGPYSVIRDCERTADFLWGQTSSIQEVEALPLAIRAFLSAQGLCHITLPDRTRQLNARASLYRSLDAADRLLGRARLDRLAYEYSQRVLYLELPIPTTVEQFLRGMLGEHAPEFFPLETFGGEEQVVLRKLRAASAGVFVALGSDSEKAAVGRLKRNHNIRIESAREARARGKTVPGGAKGYRLQLD